MTEAEDQDNHAVIFELTNYAVIPGPIPPELSEAWTGQGLSDTAWVVQLSNALVEEFQDAPTVLRIESVEVSLSLAR
ncbi:MAG TPA: hypothetical protein VJX29_01400 [Candidatus Acidoferrales bacterium]|nr:hypothetical protein [Candidatus Acidoferrales bacterium]